MLRMAALRWQCTLRSSSCAGRAVHAHVLVAARALAVRPSATQQQGRATIEDDVPFDESLTLNKIAVKGRLLEAFSRWTHQPSNLAFGRAPFVAQQMAMDKGAPQTFFVQLEGEEAITQAMRFKAGDEVYVEGSVHRHRLDAPPPEGAAAEKMVFLISATKVVQGVTPPADGGGDAWAAADLAHAPAAEQQRAQQQPPGRYGRQPPQPQQQHQQGSPYRQRGGAAAGTGGRSPSPPAQNELPPQQRAGQAQQGGGVQRYGARRGSAGQPAVAAAAAAPAAEAVAPAGPQGGAGPSRYGSSRAQRQASGGSPTAGAAASAGQADGGSGGGGGPAGSSPAQGAPSRTSQRDAALAGATLETLWQHLADNPSAWWDNRGKKTNPKAPDFVHKARELNIKPLWVESKGTPAWAKERFGAAGKGAVDAAEE